MKQLVKKLNILLLTALCSILLWSLAGPLAAKAGETQTFADGAGTITYNDNGTMTVKYVNDTTLKMKILVQNEDKSYNQQYDYTANSITLPLTAGSIKYVIKVCRNIEGTRYSVIGSASFDLTGVNLEDTYLYTNTIVNYKLSDEIVKRAAELTKGCKTERETVEALYKYVVENFKYNSELSAQINAGTVKTYTPDLPTVYANRRAICYDYSVMLAAMLRTRGIKVRVVTGVPDKSMVNGYHAWNEVYDSTSKTWYVIDATYDSAYYNAGQSYKLDKNKALYSNITYIY